MSAESQLYAALAADAPLVGLVGGRITPNVMSEAPVYPAVVYERVSSDPVYSISSVLLCEWVDMVIDVWAATRTEADTIGDRVGVALAAAGEQVSARENSYDEKAGLYACTLGCRLLVDA